MLKSFHFIEIPLFVQYLPHYNDVTLDADNSHNSASEWSH